MKVIIAPDSFKECLSSPQVAAAMADGARARWPEAQVVELPLADGGEGTLEVLSSALGARPMKADVHDPLGRYIEARYACTGSTAIIEVAQAVGLSLLSPSERNPLKASSLGLGELLVAAYDEGCTRFVVGLGGTATCDGGAGMLRAPGIERLRGTIELLCDVEAPFVGPHGAARVFAPQKGASPEDVEVLEKRMLAQAYALQVRTGVDVSALPGAGAAGGLAGALLACFGATIHPGIDRVLDLVHFDDALLGASLIITGEGKSDAQTLMGKVPMGVLRHAGASLHTGAGADASGRARAGEKAGKGARVGDVPVALLSGRIVERSALERAGFHPVVEVTPRLLPLQEALDPRIAVQNLHQAVLKMPFLPNS